MATITKVDFSQEDYLSNLEEQLRLIILEYKNLDKPITIETSGSTGQPKTICLDRSDIVASAQLTADFFDLDSSSKMLLCLPAKYIAGRMMLYRAMVYRCCLLVVQPTSLPLKNLDETIDFVAMTPMQVQNTIEKMPEKLALINTLLIGGAPVSNRLEQQVLQIHSNSHLSYGMTETLSHVAIRKLGKSYFEALRGVQFAQDHRGCLEILAQHLGQKKFSTNDLVFLVDSKHFIWEGRVDRVVNSGGIKLLPELLEKKVDRIFNCPFYFTGIDDEKLGQKLVLLIESKKEDTAHQALVRNLERILDSYERPKHIFYVDKFIQTASGKIDRINTSKLYLP